LSQNNNRISFFGITHAADPIVIGGALINHAFKFLNEAEPIHINEINSTAKWIMQIKELLLGSGFVYTCDDAECGVPVSTYVKYPKKRRNSRIAPQARFSNPLP